MCTEPSEERAEGRLKKDAAHFDWFFFLIIRLTFELSSIICTKRFKSHFPVITTNAASIILEEESSFVISTSEAIKEKLGSSLLDSVFW